MSAIWQFESGLRTPLTNDLLAMRRAFEVAGIVLNDDPAGITYAGTASASDRNGTGAAP